MEQKAQTLSTLVDGERATFTSSVFLKHPETPTQWSVLLVYHKRFNTWLPIGGEMHHGEMPLHCAMREVEEETGIDTDSLIWIENEMPYSPPGFMGYEEHQAGSKGWHLNFVFQAISPTKEVKLCDEHTQARWFTRGDLITLVHDLLPNVKYCLNEIYGPEPQR